MQIFGSSVHRNTFTLSAPMAAPSCWLAGRRRVHWCHCLGVGHQVKRLHVAGIMTVTAPGMPHALKLPLPKATQLNAEACSGGSKAKEGSAGLQRQIRICADSVSSMQVSGCLQFPSRTFLFVICVV